MACVPRLAGTRASLTGLVLLTAAAFSGMALHAAAQTYPTRVPEADALAVKDLIDRTLNLVEEGATRLLDFIENVWAWAIDQIDRLTQVPWEKWPLWKQVLLVVVAGFVIYALFLALRQLWSAALNVLSALVSFVGTLIVTLPAIVLAGAVALGGLWVINNYHDLSSLHALRDLLGGDGGGNSPPPVRHGPRDTTGGTR